MYASVDSASDPSLTAAGRAWRQESLYLVALCGGFIVPETLFLLAFLVRSGHTVEYPGWRRVRQLSDCLVRPVHYCWPLVLLVVYGVPVLAWVCVMLVVGAIALKVGPSWGLGYLRRWT
jgi:hypothetical protein